MCHALTSVARLHFLLHARLQELATETVTEMLAARDGAGHACVMVQILGQATVDLSPKIWSPSVQALSPSGSARAAGPAALFPRAALCHFSLCEVAGLQNRVPFWLQLSLFLLFLAQWSAKCARWIRQIMAMIATVILGHLVSKAPMLSRSIPKPILGLRCLGWPRR